MPQQRLFVTDAFTVLQDAFITAVQTLKAADPLASLTVLVPSNLLALRLRRAVARAGHGHVGLHFFTLIDFAYEFAANVLAAEEQQPLPPQAASLLGKKLLREAAPGNYFSPLAEQPGFPGSLLHTIDDLKQSGISPRHLRLFLEQARPTGVYRQKIESVLALYTAYMGFLTEQKLYDSTDLLERAAALLEATPGTTPLFIYGFYDFTPLQRRLLAAAMRQLDVFVFFPWRIGTAYDYATPTLTWLTSLGLHYSALATMDENKNKLTILQARLFESMPPALPASQSDDSVTLISAPGESREAREIARLILQLARSRGLRFYEIAVLLRDPTQKALVVDTLHELGIPCFLHGGLPLLRTSAGQALLLLCQVLTEEYTRSRVIEFLSMANPPFAALLGDLADYARITRWEAWSLQAGIVKGAQEWRERLSHLVDEGQDQLDHEDRRVLHAFVSLMEGFLTAGENLPRRNTWRGWVEQTMRMLHTYVSPMVHSAAVEEELLRLSELDLLGEPVSITDWSDSVAAMLTTATVPLGAFEKEGVCVADLLGTRGVQFRAVIVPGLVEGRLPRSARQDPLLLDAERQHLGEVLSCDVPQRRRVSEGERLLFTLAIQSATEHLALTFSRLDHTGSREQVPSFYLLRVIETLSGQPTSFADVERWSTRIPLVPISPPSADSISSAIDGVEFHLNSAARALAAQDPAPLGYLPTVMPFFSRALHAVHQRCDTAQLTVFDGLLIDDPGEARSDSLLFPYLTQQAFSASALETYARCPFRYFLGSILGLTLRDDPEDIFMIQPRDRGALLHSILRDFYSRLRHDKLLPLTTQQPATLVHLLTQVAETHFQAFARGNATGFTLLWELERERMHERLVALLTHEREAERDFLPAAFEARFGTGMMTASQADDSDAFFPTAPVHFALANDHKKDGENISLRGRMDRIDVSSDQQRACIIDYKTGKPFRGRFAGGLALQLPLYFYAGRCARPDLDWQSAAYVYVDQRGRSVPVCTAETWPEVLTTLRQVVTTLVQGIRSGWFFQQPDTCQPCPFPAICGAQAQSRSEHKHNDPRCHFLRQVRAVE